MVEDSVRFICMFFLEERRIKGYYFFLIWSEWKAMGS